MLPPPQGVQTFKIRGGCEGGGKGYLAREDGAFTVSSNQDQHLFTGAAVRRLTPRECERLQGIPDDYTYIPVKRVSRKRLAKPSPYHTYLEIDGEVWLMAADGPRYKSIGNSMAVPVMKWLGERIELVDLILGK